MLPDDPDDQARFFYFAILALAVAGGVLHSYRDRLGTALQHAAIWVLIFLGATLAYGFKDSLITILRPDLGQELDQGAVMLRRGEDGHFHASLRVNGTDVTFMIDTGASNIVLTQQDARRLGMNVASLDYAHPASTANGTVYGAGVVLDRMELGGNVDRDVRAMVNGGPMDQSLLGMDYLDRFRRLRFEGDRLYLER